METETGYRPNSSIYEKAVSPDTIIANKNDNVVPYPATPATLPTSTYTPAPRILLSQYRVTIGNESVRFNAFAITIMVRH